MNVNVNKSEETNKPTTIEMVNVEEFPANMKINLVSSIDMADVVSSLFGSAFADFYGCNVRLNSGNDKRFLSMGIPAGAIYVDLFFKENNNPNSQGIRALSRINNPANEKKDYKPGHSVSAEAYQRFQNVANAGGLTYNFSKEAYEVLTPFAFGNGNPRWFKEELSAAMMAIGTKEEAVVCIHGLSLEKILCTIYGTNTDEGEFDYAVTPSTVIPYQNQEFIMQVIQLNKRIVRKLQQTLSAGNNYSVHPYNC